MSQIESRGCSKGCLIGDTCWKDPLGKTEVSFLAEGAFDSLKSACICPAWGISSLAQRYLPPLICGGKQWCHDGVGTNSLPTFLVHSCTLAHGPASKESANTISFGFHVWTENYTFLTSFEMVMHCLKCSGKQSSTTNANMCNDFDLVIISSPKFSMFLSFQHQINELFYWKSTRAIASIISISISLAGFCFIHLSL